MLYIQKELVEALVIYVAKKLPTDQKGTSLGFKISLALFYLLMLAIAGIFLHDAIYFPESARTLCNNSGAFIITLFFPVAMLYIWKYLYNYYFPRDPSAKLREKDILPFIAVWIGGGVALVIFFIFVLDPLSVSTCRAYWGIG